MSFSRPILWYHSHAYLIWPRTVLFINKFFNSFSYTFLGLVKVHYSALRTNYHYVPRCILCIHTAQTVWTSNAWLPCTTYTSHHSLRSNDHDLPHQIITSSALHITARTVRPYPSRLHQKLSCLSPFPIPFPPAPFFPPPDAGVLVRKLSRLTRSAKLSGLTPGISYCCVKSTVS